MTWIAVDLLRLKKTHIFGLAFRSAGANQYLLGLLEGNGAGPSPCMTVISPQLEAVMRLSSRI